MVFDQQLKEALAAAARVQIHARIKGYTGVEPELDYLNRYLIDKNFTDFFSTLDLSQEDSLKSGLVTNEALTKKEYQELDKYKFSYGGTKECSPLMEFRPRGVIIADRIEDDKRRRKTLADKLRAEAMRASKRFGKIFTFGRRGENVFSSENEYRRLLRKSPVYKMMKSALDRDVEYLGWARCDFYTPNYEPKKGWFRKWAGHIKAPILIIPGISTSDLEALIRLEKERLKLA